MSHGRIDCIRLSEFCWVLASQANGIRRLRVNHALRNHKSICLASKNTSPTSVVGEEIGVEGSLGIVFHRRTCAKGGLVREGSCADIDTASREVGRLVWGEGLVGVDALKDAPWEKVDVDRSLVWVSGGESTSCLLYTSDAADE